MKDNTKFTPKRLGDYTFSCNICGQKWWRSQATVLDIYTGRGGLTVCPNCNDPIDYGLVPFKIPKEEHVPDSSPDIYTSTVGAFDPITDYQTQNPMAITPQNPSSVTLTWGENPYVWDSTQITWDGI